MSALAILEAVKNGPLAMGEVATTGGYIDRTKTAAVAGTRGGYAAGAGNLVKDFVFRYPQGRATPEATEVRTARSRVRVLPAMLPLSRVRATPSTTSTSMGPRR